MRPDPAERIDRRAVTVWRIAGGLTAVQFAVAAGIVAGLAAAGIVPATAAWAAMAAAAAIAAIAVLVVPKVRWMRWRYEVSEHEVYLGYGLVVRRRVLIPMARVQHVDTKAGPLLRAFGLSTVTVTTAGSTHEIPALSDSVADGLRDRIAALARVTDDVV
ncbi:MAG TPA: PH domain-containing protein [Desulfobacterales bacterium]|nr:PH domain-containing protein [Desulfobacterales bacterium]